MIAAKLSQDYWYSTQTTAYSLIAIARYCGKNASGAKIISAANIDGKQTDINSATYSPSVCRLFSKALVQVMLLSPTKAQTLCTFA